MRDFEQKGRGASRIPSSPTTAELIKQLQTLSTRDQMLGELLLHCADYADVSTMENLLDHHHVPIDFSDEASGLTALHIAVGRDHLYLAKLLVERGAAFQPDKRGRMPTTVAAECEVSDDMCDFIAEAEAKAEGV
jgi:ankyrin repeat protein